jgi:hypothetical protein
MRLSDRRTRNSGTIGDTNSDNLKKPEPRRGKIDWLGEASHRLGRKYVLNAEVCQHDFLIVSVAHDMSG